jgi:hypothetical protein
VTREHQKEEVTMNKIKRQQKHDMETSQTNEKEQEIDKKKEYKKNEREEIEQSTVTLKKNKKSTNKIRIPRLLYF